ncbi:hypothetical protein J6590_050683 [Homalodisca vitripennis]|nr:hypothetical protein J6590_050683 [Homalodisca vitripennis]
MFHLVVRQSAAILCSNWSCLARQCGRNTIPCRVDSRPIAADRVSIMAPIAWNQPRLRTSRCHANNPLRPAPPQHFGLMSTRQRFMTHGNVFCFNFGPVQGKVISLVLTEIMRCVYLLNYRRSHIHRDAAIRIHQKQSKNADRIQQVTYSQRCSDKRRVFTLVSFIKNNDTARMITFKKLTISLRWRRERYKSRVCCLTRRWLPRLPICL